MLTRLLDWLMSIDTITGTTNDPDDPTDLFESIYH